MLLLLLLWNAGMIRTIYIQVIGSGWHHVCRGLDFSDRTQRSRAMSISVGGSC